MNRAAERIAARRLADEQARRTMEDRVLAHVADLHEDDYSPEAVQARETAVSIAEHREMAAKRRVWLAADALGIPPALVPAEQELTTAAMTRQQWYEAYADLLELCGQLQAGAVVRGLLDADLVIARATQPRSAQDMALAAEALARGTDQFR